MNVNHHEAGLPGAARDTDHGLVLCGGEGRRMGGQDKAALVVAGQPLAAWAAGHLIATGVAQERLWLSRHAGMADLPAGVPGRPLLDRRAERAGPLAGVEAALHELARLEQAGAKVAGLRIVPCDVWPWPPALTDWWQAAAMVPGPVCLHDGERLHPVVARLTRPSAGWLAQALALGEWLDAGHRRLRECWSAWGVQALHSPQALRNLNAPSDWPAA